MALRLRSFDSDLGELAARQPKAPAIITRGELEAGVISYAELDELIERFCAFLQDQGVKPGDVLVSLLPNSTEALITFLGTARFGATYAPLSCNATSRELSDWLDLVKPKLIFSTALDRTTSPSSLGSERGITVLEISEPGFGWLPKKRQRSQPSTPHDSKLLVATSGTTGRPKAMVLDIDRLWSSGVEFAKFHALPDGELRFWNYLPTSYLGGLFNLCLIPLATGGSIFIDEPFSGRTLLGFWHTVSRFEINALWFAPSILLGLLKLAERQEAGYNLECGAKIKKAFLGMAPVSLATKKLCRSTFGIDVLENFALGETTFFSSETPQSLEQREEASVGGILPYVEVSFRSSGLDASEGPPEILVKTPFLFDGYLDESGLVSAETDEDGFFATGDLGHLTSEGNLVVTGRRRDIIKKGGLLVALREIEVLAESHPAVREAAAVKIDHSFYGESYELYLLLDTCSTDELKAEIDRFLHTNLVKHKWPERTVVKSEFPRTSSGKVRKHLLDAGPAEPTPMKKPPLQLCQKVKEIPQALSIYINQLVYDQKRKGKDITVLSLGEAFFDIPQFSFSKTSFVKGYHYSDSQGLPELRAKIAEFYKKEYDADIEPKEEILITAGSKPAIFFAIQAVLNPGDEAIILEPGWLSYKEQICIVGGVPTFIPYDCEIDEFHTHFSSKTKMLIICNPNNPSGRLYTTDELESIYRQCRERGIYVLIDEAYSDFILEDETFHTMAKVVPDKDGVIIANSLSKNMGMSGWRIGYVVSTPEVIRHILKLNQHIITCAPTVLQYYMATYFDQITAITLPQVAESVQRRQRVATMMDEIGLKRLKGNSTFYFMVSIDPFPGDVLDFALHLLLYNQVAVVPGFAYGDSVARFIRVGIGTESEERIHDALLMIKDLINISEYDPGPVRALLREEGFRPFVRG